MQSTEDIEAIPMIYVTWCNQTHDYVACGFAHYKHNTHNITNASRVSIQSTFLQFTSTLPYTPCKLNWPEAKQEVL